MSCRAESSSGWPWHGHYNLDERATAGVFGLFQQINASGTSILMATHDAELIRQHRDMRVIELEQGRLVFDSAGDAAS